MDDIDETGMLELVAVSPSESSRKLKIPNRRPSIDGFSYAPA